MWGHLPLLCNQTYTNYIKEIASAIEHAKTTELDQLLYEKEVKTATLRHEGVSFTSKEFLHAKKELLMAQSIARRYPSQQMQLTRVFLWTIEFSILKSSQKRLQIIGAGILSSPQEWLNIIEGKIKTQPYTFDAAIELDFKYFSDLQQELFVAPNLDYYRYTLSRSRVNNK